MIEPAFREHVRRAIEIAGSQSALARKLGITQQGISYLLQARQISAETAAAIDKATDGQVSKRDLRPDLWP